MDKQTFSALLLAILSLVAVIYLSVEVHREWKNPNKRGQNLIYSIAIIFGLFTGVISTWRILHDLWI